MTRLGTTWYTSPLPRVRLGLWTRRRASVGSRTIFDINASVAGVVRIDESGLGWFRLPEYVDRSEGAPRMEMDLESRASHGGLMARSAPRPAPSVAGPLADDGVDVVVARLDGGPGAVRASAGLLSDAERARADRFAFERDRWRFILARGRLRQLLAERLDVRPEAVELGYRAYGKPMLAGRFARSGLRFNLSHCDDLAVFALASGREVGIDVEAVRVLADADDIAAHTFSHRESAAYQALDPRERPLGFFQCWTRKEAFIKALGDGLQHPLDRFDVSLAPREPARILRVDDTPGDHCGWRMEGFSPAPGFVAAVVVEDQEHRGGRARPDLLGDGTSWPR